MIPSQSKCSRSINNVCKDCGKQFQKYYAYCVKCNEMKQKNQLELCAKCDRNVPKNQTHCCKCGLHNILNKDQKHCCQCKKKWNPKSKNHCHKCCLIYDGTFNTHCCECKNIWNLNVDKHCCSCKINYNKEFDHCCQCNKLWNPNKQKHCEDCCTNYDKKLAHCCTCDETWNSKVNKHCCSCNIIYDKKLEHCCTCKEKWDSETLVHCNEIRGDEDQYSCCIIHDKKLSHCCDCQEIWNFSTHDHCYQCCNIYDNKLKHCCDCEITYDPATIDHCCSCEKTWNLINEKHCEKCCKIYNINLSHCCDCQIEWNPNDHQHCNDCCLIIKNDEHHCCTCQTIFDKPNADCDCQKVIDIIINKTNTFTKGWITQRQFIISKCLNKKCQAFKKFITGLKLIGLHNVIKFLSSNSNYKLVYHGTPSIENARTICCDSWNINRRDRQKCGPGEYFTTRISRGNTYATDTGAVVISMIVTANKAGTKSVYKSSDETWYVVKNDHTVSFCLPVAIVKYITRIDQYNMCPKQETELELERQKKEKEMEKQRILEMQQKINDDSCKISFYDQKWIEYDNDSKKKLIENAKQDKLIFDITAPNGNVYKIDLTDMTQRNMSTRYKRKIQIQ
jgi:WWE domain